MIFIHHDVLEKLHKNESLARRLGIVLRQIAAQGRPNRIKSCSDKENQGWLRTPVNGMHHYLWWSKHDSDQVADLEPSSDEIFLRAIRHHDDHVPLKCGRRSDYIELSVQHLIEERILEKINTSPWTHEQQAFIQADDATVRIVLGKPGSGKTASLWRAVELHHGKNLLYLTWSEELARQADKHFGALAPERAITCWPFTQLLRELTDQDKPNLTLAQSRQRFQEALQCFAPKLLGPWKKHQNTLHAELRAFLIGRACPGHPSTGFKDPFYHLLKEEYIDQRRSNRRQESLNTAWHVFTLLARNNELSSIFPELAVASEAIKQLDEGHFPEALRSFEGIVVDEVQDLTLLEFSLVMRVWHILAEYHMTTPLLLLAGDEGQTVRPTGFSWGPYKSLMTEPLHRRKVRITSPRDFVLTASLRCPSDIKHTFDRAAAYYKKLDREQRPTRQLDDSSIAEGGCLFYVTTRDSDQAEDLIQELAEQGSTLVVSLEDDPSSDDLWTPALVKGLERQNVVVLNPGALLEELEQYEPDDNLSVDREDYRNQIDRLRVVLSRASETLVFLDVNPSEQQRTYSKELLGPGAEEIEPSELLKALRDGNVTFLERVVARLEEFRARIDEDPASAFRLAIRAWNLFNKGRTQGDLEAAIGREVRVALLRSVARLLVYDGSYTGPAVNDLQQVEKAAEEQGKNHLEALRQLVQWHRSGRSFPANLLEAASRLTEPNEWLQQELSGIAKSLFEKLEQGSRHAECARAFTGDVATWLQFIDYRGNVEEEVQRLRCNAFDTLLERRNLDEAERLLDLIEPDDLLRRGRLLEAQGEYERALEVFQKAGSDADVKRLRDKIFHFSSNELRVFRRLAEQCTSPEQIPALIASVSGSLQEPLPEIGDRYLRMVLGGRKKPRVQEPLSIFQDYLATVHRHADTLEDPELMILGGLEALIRSRHASARQAAQRLFEHYGTRSLARRLLTSPLAKFSECAEPAILYLAGQALQTLRHCLPYQNLQQLLDDGKQPHALPDG